MQDWYTPHRCGGEGFCLLVIGHSLASELGTLCKGGRSLQLGSQGAVLGCLQSHAAVGVSPAAQSSKGPPLTRLRE